MRFKRIWVMVYKDTITPMHEEDGNMTEILISESMFKKFYEKYAKQYFPSYEIFKTHYTCDDTEGLYRFVMENGYVFNERDL